MILKLLLFLLSPPQSSHKGKVLFALCGHTAVSHVHAPSRETRGPRYKHTGVFVYPLESSYRVQVVGWVTTILLSLHLYINHEAPPAAKQGTIYLLVVAGLTTPVVATSTLKRKHELSLTHIEGAPHQVTTENDHPSFPCYSECFVVEDGCLVPGICSEIRVAEDGGHRDIASLAGRRQADCSQRSSAYI